ncbi:20158_t:CDS:10, partial [Cetraspora pellucida]
MNSQYQKNKSSERKRANPLIDLIETEKTYINDLRCLLKRVTSCWSSKDLPPPELDILFLAIEEIYKRNKQFYSKLAKLGASPQSAEELGDTLVGWVDEMEEPYTNYCRKYRQGFDDRKDIEENLVLQQTLNDISAENNQPVSLDYFFDIPMKRIHYYKKLYMRLFKSTEPGRSDHIILASANERLDLLINLEKQVKESNLKDPIITSQKLYHTVPSHLVEERAITPNKDQVFPSNNSLEQEPESYSPLRERIQQDHIHSPMPQRLHSPISPIQDYEYPQVQKQVNEPIYAEVMESTISDYFSNDDQPDWNILDLQNFIDTSKTFDILTKQPRKINLNLQPSSLPFKRELILYDDFIIEVPEYDSDERFHVRAHLFLLTDLLLVCQKIDIKDQHNIPNFKYWLMYQPLSGKHLSIRDISYEEGDMLELTIMRDETMIIFPQSDNKKDIWFNEISKAIKFASAGAINSILPTNFCAKGQSGINRVTLIDLSIDAQIRMVRPQVNTDVRNLNSAGSSPNTLSTSPNTGASLTPNSLSQSRSPTNLGHSPTNMGHSPTNMVHSPTNLGHSPTNMGHSPTNLGHSPTNLGHSPTNLGHSATNLGHLSTGSFKSGLPARPNQYLGPRSRTLDLQRDSGEEYDYKPGSNNYNQTQDRISDPSSSSSINRAQLMSSLK